MPCVGAISLFLGEKQFSEVPHPQKIRNATKQHVTWTPRRPTSNKSPSLHPESNPRRRGARGGARACAHPNEHLCIEKVGDPPKGATISRLIRHPRPSGLFVALARMCNTGAERRRRDRGSPAPGKLAKRSHKKGAAENGRPLSTGWEGRGKEGTGIAAAGIGSW